MTRTKDKDMVPLADDGTTNKTDSKVEKHNWSRIENKSPSPAVNLNNSGHIGKGGCGAYYESRSDKIVGELNDSRIIRNIS